MPGLWQLPQHRLFEHAIKHFLIAQKAIDTGAFAAGQAVTGQIKGQHGKPLFQRPLDQMPIQPHVVIVPMQNKQGAARHRRFPDLHCNAETVHLNTAEMLCRTLAEIDTVVTGITSRSRVHRPPRLKAWQLVDKGSNKSLVH